MSSRRKRKQKSRLARMSWSERFYACIKPLITKRYRTTTKLLGETPLEATEHLRNALHLPPNIPLAYAGRLDPMATGKLLILIGDTCKKQELYHAFDKEYEVELLLGAHSDSGDVLGIIQTDGASMYTKEDIMHACNSCIGAITLPYPHFSSKTVQGKALHTWALEERLNEIQIPQKQSNIYSIKATKLCTVSKYDISTQARKKINTIPHVTDARKKLGADFRRTDVLASWEKFEESPQETFQVLSFTCIASSGTYMRSLAEHIASKLGTQGLALSIHRTKIGTYKTIYRNHGFWLKSF